MLLVPNDAIAGILSGQRSSGGQSMKERQNTQKAQKWLCVCVRCPTPKTKVTNGYTTKVHTHRVVSKSSPDCHCSLAQCSSCCCCCCRWHRHWSTQSAADCSMLKCSMRSKSANGRDQSMGRRKNSTRPSLSCSVRGREEMKEGNVCSTVVEVVFCELFPFFHFSKVKRASKSKPTPTDWLDLLLFCCFQPSSVQSIIVFILCSCFMCCCCCWCCWCFHLPRWCLSACCVSPLYEALQCRREASTEAKRRVSVRRSTSRRWVRHFEGCWWRWWWGWGWWGWE